MLKNSFISGAAVLMAANAVSKILGAVFKIPLTYIIHEEGMAIYNTAFSVYVMVLSFVVSGIPFAVTKITAKNYAEGRYDVAKSAVFYANVILFFVGMAGSLLLWVGADFFALAMKEPRAVWAIRLIAPSIFFVAAGVAAKSGFQGNCRLIPTAVSQCLEAVVKLVAGYFLAVWLVGLGRDCAAAGAIFGVTVGEAIATGILVIWFGVTYGHTRRKRGIGRECLNELVTTALPVLFMSITGSVINMVDTSLLRAGLLRAGLTEATARHLYGAYTGYAMTILNLPSGFLATLGVSVIPVISAASAVGNMQRVRSVSQKGLWISGVCGLLATLFIAVLGEWILDLLFNNTASAQMLRISAPSVMFICVMQFAASILQAMGYMGRVFVSSVVVGVIKIASAIFLVSLPDINIYGAAIGTDIAYFVGMVMNLAFLAIKTECV